MRLLVNVLLMLCLSFGTSGCRTERGNVQKSSADGITPPELAAGNQDWPGSRIFQQYRDALSMYESGKNRDALELVRKVSGESLRIAPDTVLGNQDDYALYIEVLGQTLSRIRHVANQNELYARSLASEGKLDEALEVIATNLALSQQMIHVEPSDVSSLVSGVTEWLGAWATAEDLLVKAGRKADSAIAAQRAERGKRFLHEHIKPFVEAKIQRQQELRPDQEDAKTNQEAFERHVSYLPDLQSLISEWDSDVDAVR